MSNRVKGGGGGGGGGDVRSTIQELGEKFPHSGRGARHGVLPKVSLSSWADKAKVSRVYMSRILSGSQVPGSQVLSRLASVAGMELGEVWKLVVSVKHKSKVKGKGK